MRAAGAPAVEEPTAQAPAEWWTDQPPARREPSQERSPEDSSPAEEAPAQHPGDWWSDQRPADREPESTGERSSALEQRPADPAPTRPPEAPPQRDEQRPDQWWTDRKPPTEPPRDQTGGTPPADRREALWPRTEEPRDNRGPARPRPEHSYLDQPHRDSSRLDPPTIRHPIPRVDTPGKSTPRETPQREATQREATQRQTTQRGATPGEATVRRDRPRADPAGEATVRVPVPPPAPKPNLDPPTVVQRPVQPPARPQNAVGAAFWDQKAPPQRPQQRPAPETPTTAVKAAVKAPAKAPAKAEPETPTTPKPARRRTPLVVAVALVAVIGLAAGVVFGVPGLSDRLGITDGGSDVAIKPPAPPVEFTPGLRGPGADAPAPTAAGVQAALAGPSSASALGTLTGMVVDPASGETLWQSDPQTPLVPASTTKLLTAAAALLSLDHTEQLVTKVVQGSAPGEVVIVGGGDPTLSSLKKGVESVYPGAAHLSDLVDQVKASGVPVQSVRVDLSRYSGESSAPGWIPADIGAGYIAPMVPAMLDGGRSDARAQNGSRTANPARALAEEFANRLGATVPAEAVQDAPSDAKVLAEVRSAPMVELVDNVLRASDNVLAEAVAREVARAAGKEASFAGASEATREVLAANGFDLAGVQLADASGLSTENRVSAGLLAKILEVAAGTAGDPRTAKLRPLLGGLPVAGGSGTLDDRYDTGDSAAGKGWVRAKTGTLSGVNSLAGVVLDQDGRVLVFALMTADTDASARPALDAIAAALRGCGCR
ncbi:D-alanyl-D-alanine carboxypeptidase/D-alanyl-D-alanine-endopeptidase [Actinophytocola xanthii]|uniref:D-alanyl-D-alanine carboxypeptidase/D-alanyl-D-alanine-endopeptidase n=1 Tax=Actinophytocola xanthii TaxID=1912961 RepID=A0A1Q8C0Q6_9PSEU|nr:D-alanyl-D-alanine carboxypeptidase/D-alanyl-D-alanine-endopeptidase [Actinophytocola xanthii]